MDEKILLLVNGYHTTWLNDFMWNVTGILPWMLFYVSILWLVFKNNKVEMSLSIVVFVALTVLLADQISATLIKPLVGRLRPTHEPSLVGQIQIVRGYVGGLYSFPSSHAANTFAVATFLSLLVHYWRMTMLCFLWAVMCSYSRVYLGVHYPSDILCGAVLGVLTGALTYYLYRLTAKKRLKKYTHGYYSTSYTSSGFLMSDMDFVSVAFLLTLIGMSF